jgi:hypothetical protein
MVELKYDDILCSLFAGFGYFILAGGLDKQIFKAMKEKLFPLDNIEQENAKESREEYI